MQVVFFDRLADSLPVPRALNIKSFLSDADLGIAKRLREARVRARMGQAELADLIGISRIRIASYEYGKAPIRYEVGKQVCYRLNLNQRWLATGKLPTRPYFDLSPNLEFEVKPRDLFLNAFERVLSPAIEERFRDLEEQLGKEAVQTGDFEDAVLDNLALVGQPPAKASAFYISKLVQTYLHWLPEPFCFEYGKALLVADAAFRRKHSKEIERLVRARLAAEKQQSSGGAVAAVAEESKKQVLTDDSLKGNRCGVKSDMAKLIARVNRAASKPGAKAALARLLDVDPPRISEWLSGKKEPGGCYTLQLLQWVEQQERQKT